MGNSGYGPYSGGYGSGTNAFAASGNSAYGPYSSGYQFQSKPADTSGSNLQTAGGITAIGGAINEAIGAYYAAKSAKLQAKAQALSLEHLQFMSNLDARAAEQEAQQLLQQGQQQIGLAGLQAAQAKGSQAAQTGAAGVQAGSGSAAEVQASIELAKRLDARSLNISAVRAAGAARRGGVNARNRAELAGVSARNLRATARTISPAGAAFTSLVGSAGQVAGYLGGG